MEYDIGENWFGLVGVDLVWCPSVVMKKRFICWFIVVRFGLLSFELVTEW